MSDESMLDSHYSQERNDVDQACSEIDRLRAELAETRDELDSFARMQREYAELINRFVPAGDALVDVAEALRDGTSSNRRANLTVAQNAWRSVRGDAPAPAEPPAVELPVTLSSPDDVVAVFRSVPGMSERAGPGSHRVYQDPRGVYLSVLEAPGPVVMIVAVHGCDGDRYTHSGPRLSRDALLAAIEAARGGSR